MHVVSVSRLAQSQLSCSANSSVVAPKVFSLLNIFASLLFIVRALLLEIEPLTFYSLRMHTAPCSTSTHLYAIWRILTNDLPDKQPCFSLQFPAHHSRDSSHAHASLSLACRSAHAPLWGSRSYAYEQFDLRSWFCGIGRRAKFGKWGALTFTSWKMDLFVDDKYITYNDTLSDLATWWKPPKRKHSKDRQRERAYQLRGKTDNATGVSLSLIYRNGWYE